VAVACPRQPRRDGPDRDPDNRGDLLRRSSAARHGHPRLVRRKRTATRALLRRPRHRLLLRLHPRHLYSRSPSAPPSEYIGRHVGLYRRSGTDATA
jgi:hypothetical protein